MKNKIVTSLLVLATSFSAVNAFADPSDRNDNRNDQRPGQGYSQNQHDDQRRQDNYQAPRNDQHYQGNNHNQRDDRNHQTPRYQQNHVEYRHDMPRPGQDWRKGQRVPTQYRGKGYYVNDWRSRDLPAPPLGHRWLNVNGDYVLVAIATGIIGSILLGGGH